MTITRNKHTHIRTHARTRVFLPLTLIIIFASLSNSLRLRIEPVRVNGFRRGVKGGNAFETHIQHTQTHCPIGRLNFRLIQSSFASIFGLF